VSDTGSPEPLVCCVHVSRQEEMFEENKRSNLISEV